MSYDLTKFNDFIARENQVLTKTLFAGGDTSKVALYMTGIKGSTVIPQLNGGATIQAGNCVNPSGGSVASEVSIEVKPFTVFEDYCNDDLQTKFPNMLLAPGSSNQGDAPSEWDEALIQNKLSDIAEQLEVMYWQGSKEAGDLFDGFLEKITASGEAIDGNVSGATEITKANVLSIIDEVRMAAPAKLRRSKDFAILVGDDVFELYVQALKEANLYHYSADNADGELKIGGSGARLVRVYGLDGTKNIVATAGQHLVVGSDLENENQVADMFYDQVSDKVYLRVKAKAGVQVTNIDEVVHFQLSA